MTAGDQSSRFYVFFAFPAYLSHRQILWTRGNAPYNWHSVTVTLFL